MDDEFHDLQCLLRLKRHEAPPPEFFEDFMAEFHRRQRAELLRRPLWRVALDRIEAALPTISVTRYAYAGACTAAVAAAALVSGHILTAPAGESGLPVQASAAALADNHSTSLPKVNIYSAHPSLRLSPELDFDGPRRVTTSTANSRPRYVLDKQPVSYDVRSGF